MRKLAYFLLLYCGLARAALAQQPTGVAALDQLVAALNSKSLAPVQPYLTPETRVSGLPATYTGPALARLLPQYGPVEGLRIVRQEPAGPNTRYVCALARQGTEKEVTLVLTPAGQFAELNLVPASTKKIDLAFGPGEIITPPSVVAPARLRNGLLLVEAEVDGRRGTFLLDTGAPALVLNKREFAAPATETTLAATGSTGVNGRMAGMSYHLAQQFDWQGISFQQKQVPTLDLTSLEQKLGGLPLLGLIGYNVLSQYAVTLDYHAGQVLLRQPAPAAAPPAALMRVPFVLSGHLPVVALTVGGQTFQVGVDCGAQANLLDQQYQAGLARELRRAATARLSGADAAARAVATARLPEVRLAGPLVFRKQATVFADMAHLNQNPSRPPLQGLVGYPLLSQYRTTIDYVKKQLYFSAW
ncbi:aspartyl protease family protein [Hymenobacter cheonanensis]|uniref:aspartyl protease family protein n=1 Tax=Hymenobacter sp. CA2-7 TaxID=3063993 RepID=UPI0027130F61|nr:aspartyl protease family protein [Hymenobacter sp. CA2-7]MDO7884490.1 aspartyl protease family protein [Hymenobacter sp. CA2-7]